MKKEERILKINEFIKKVEDLSYHGQVEKEIYHLDIFLIDNDFDLVFPLLRLEFIEGNIQLIQRILLLINKAIEKLNGFLKSFDDEQMRVFIASKIHAAKRCKFKIEDSFFVEKITTSKKIHSYQWQGLENDLKELFNDIKGKLISDDTEWTEFKTIFSGLPVDEITPIKWHDDNTTELLFFDKQLQETESVDKLHANKYDRLKSCFVKPDGSQFNGEFKQLANQSRWMHKTKQNFITKLF